MSTSHSRKQSKSPKKKSGGKKQRKHSSKRLIQASFDQACDLIFFIDDQGHVLDANRSVQQRLGLSRHAILSRSLSSFLSADACASLGDNVPQAPLAGEVTLIDAASHPVEMEYTLTLNVPDGHHLFVLRDINPRRQTIEADLKRQRQKVELFAEVTLKIRQSLQLNDILHTTVTEVQRLLKADRVLIYQVLSNGTGRAMCEAVLPTYPALLGMEFPEEVFPKDYRHLYQQGRVRAISDVHDPAAKLAACLVEFTDQFEIKAKLIVPIVHTLTPPSQDAAPTNQLWGLLIAHQCSRPRQWVDFELELMQQLADQISVALAQAQLLEHQEEMVQVRTRELTQANQNLQQEINDRMQAEAALRQSEEQLRLITNALPVLIAYIDHQQNYRFNNQAYENWLGMPAHQIYGCHLKTIWGHEVYQRIQPYVEAALSGQAVTYENDILPADGKARSVDVTYIPHWEETKTVQGFFALTSDISDRKAIERMKDEFISVVSHELRTPLTSLHSALKILATGQLDPYSNDGQQMLGIADDSTERLVRLVNNVLDLQRIESGKVIIDGQACSAAILMTQATAAMQAMAHQHGITLVNEPQDVRVWADADYIMQTLTNLLSNAIKFSSAGGTVWLTVNTEKYSPSGQPFRSRGRQKNRKHKVMRTKSVPTSTVLENLHHREQGFESYVLFQVRDEGQGIPANQLQRIFERFQQVDSSDSRKKGGTGLGLTICQKIIEQHSGKIWAESEPGKGSIFSFTLPAING